MSTVTLLWAVYSASVVAVLALHWAAARGRAQVSASDLLAYMFTSFAPILNTCLVLAALAWWGQDIFGRLGNIIIWRKK